MKIQVTTQHNHKFRDIACTIQADGRVEVEQCNNCLAVRVTTFANSNRAYDERTKTITVVEPPKQTA